ncbi:MAG: hypothetical protein ACUVTD_04720 [Nitrososphaerales archaeon]
MSYPRLKTVGFLLPRPDSIPTHTERRLPTAKPFPRATSGRWVTEVLVSTGVNSGCPIPTEG